MITWIERKYFHLQIKLLVLLKPSVLFDKINRLDWYQDTLRQWVDDQSFFVNSKVLEVGCASGALTSYIASSGCIPTGVDYSSDMIEFARIKNNGIDFLVADVFDLPFEDNSFDGVIAASLVNIVDDKSKTIEELSRTCKKGGAVSILVPLAGFSDDDLYSLQESLGNSGFSYAAMKAWHKFPPKMKVSDLEILFEQAGLTEIITKYYLQGMVVSVTAIKPL